MNIMKALQSIANEFKREQTVYIPRIAIIGQSFIDRCCYVLLMNQSATIMQINVTISSYHFRNGLNGAFWAD